MLKPPLTTLIKVKWLTHIGSHYSGQQIVGPRLARLSRIGITSHSEALLWSLVSLSALGYQLQAKGDWNSGSTLHLDHTAGYISKGGF